MRFVVNAALAHLVERHLAKVEVASSSLVGRSKQQQRPGIAGALLLFGASVSLDSPGGNTRAPPGPALCVSGEGLSNF